MRSRLVLLVLASAAILTAALIWKSSDHETGGSQAIGGSGNPGHETKAGYSSGRLNADELSGRNTGRIRSDEADSGGDGEDGVIFPMVDLVLSDDTLSTEETTKRLRDLVLRQDVSLLEREEALAHGLILDFKSFATLVEDPLLPQPLALRLFDAALNENESRDMQIRVCLALMEHEDEALRAEASEQVAFFIGFEELVDQPDVLKQEARSFLDDLAAQPNPEVEAPNPDANIPETAPIETEPVDEQEVVNTESSEL